MNMLGGSNDGQVDANAVQSPFFNIMDTLAQAHSDEIRTLRHEISQLQRELVVRHAFPAASLNATNDLEFQPPDEFPPYTPRPVTKFTPRRPLCAPRKLLSLPIHHEHKGANSTRIVRSPYSNLPAAANKDFLLRWVGMGKREDAIDSLGAQDLRDSIGNLTKQQESLHQKIIEILACSGGRAPPRVNRLNSANSALVSNSAVAHRFSAADTVRRQLSHTLQRQSQGAQRQSHASQRQTTINMNTTSTMRSRFAVQTGRTREFLRDSVFHDKFEIIKIASMYAIVNSKAFNILSSGLILVYALFIAFETEMLAQNLDNQPESLKIFHYAFNATFCLELLIRVAAEGHRAFFGKDAIWNRLDAVLIMSALLEIIMEALAAGALETSASVVRAVRIARVIRTVRLVRTFRHFHEFQKMAYALVSSFSTLVCSLMLLLFIMFFFAVGLTQLAADKAMRDQIHDLDLRYGNMMSTLYTLFLSVSNGISWDLSFMPLFHLGWRSAAGFICYIIITLFGVLNVVTSIFVESVLRSTQHYKELIVQDKESAKQVAMLHMKELFHQLDSDDSGVITCEELQNMLKEESLRKYVSALDIDTEDAQLLFNLLDHDGSNEINFDEFCEGCLRLKGNARAIDVQTLIFQIRNFLEKWSDFTHFVEAEFDGVRDSRAN